MKATLITLATAAWFLMGQTSPAADGSWNVNAAGSWVTNGSWNPAAAPGSTTTNNPDAATFNFTLTADRLVTVDANRFIGGISFGNTSAFKYTLQTGILHLNNGGVIQTLAANGNHTDTISSAIVIEGDGGATTFTAGASSVTSLLSIGAVTGVSTGSNVTTLTFNGTNTGANAITGIMGNGSLGGSLAVVKDGAGTWTLSGANTYSGGVTLTTGKLNINSAGVAATNGPLGNGGAFSINGGMIDNTSGAAKVLLNVNPITIGGDFAFSTPTGTVLNNLTLPGAVTMAADRTITLNGSGALTLSGKLTNIGDSVRTLTVNNGTGTGSTTLLTIGSYDLTGVGSTGARNDIINGSGNVTISGVVADGTSAGSSLTCSGGGILTLSGSNTYSGGTTISSGTVKVGSATALGASTGAVSVAAGAALDLNGKTMTNTNALTLNGTGAGSGGALTNSSASGGTYAGLMTLGSNNVSIGGTGTITLSNTGTVHGTSTGYNLNLQGAGGTINSIINGGTSGVAGAGAVIVNTTGTWTLNGSNTFTGGLTIKAGTAKLGNTTGAGTGTITIGDSGGGANATLQVGGGANATYTNPISVASGNNGVATININPGGNGNSVSGPITLNNHDLFVNANVGYGSHTMTGGFSGTGNLTFGGIAPLTIGAVAINGSITNNMSNVLTIGGNIGPNVTSVTQNSSSALILSGANSYTVPTVVNSGTLQVNGNNALGTGVVNFPTGAGTLKAGIAGLVVANNMSITGASATMDTGANYIALSGAIGGPGSLTKTGTGTMILSGLSSYGGATTISQGTLRLAGTGSALGNIMSTGDSITYGLHGSNAGYRGPLYNLIQTAGYSSRYVGNYNGNPGSLPTTPVNQTAHDGNSGWNIAQVLNGITPIAQGGLGWMSSNPQIITLLIGINDRNLNDGTDVSMIPGLMIQYGNLIDSIFQQRPTVRLYVGKLTPCNVYVNAFNASLVTLVNAKQATGDNIAIVDLNTNFPANGLYDGIHPNDVGYAWMAQQWFNAITADHPVVFSPNVLPATTAVSLASGATLDLDGVSQTIASLADSGTTAITNSSTVRPVTLTINPPAGSTTYSGTISDSGTANAISLVKSGAGTQVLAGTNNYSGGTTITGGILNISTDTNLGATAGALIFSGGTLQLGAGVTINASRLVTLTASGGVMDTQANTGTIAASIGGAGGLTKVGNGTLILTGLNSYSGSTTVNSGTLSLATPSLADASDVYLTTGAVLNLNFSGTDAIHALFIDGVCQSSGTWGGIGSAATHTTALITGTGLLNVATGPSFESWINGFSSLSIADRAPGANPSGDGINNLLKYALGGDPRVASQAILPEATPASGKLALSFARTLANTDVTMTVQATDSLTGTWIDLASSVNGAAMSALVGGVVVSETGTGATRTVEVRDLHLTSDPNHPCRFMRLQVIHP